MRRIGHKASLQSRFSHRHSPVSVSDSSNNRREETVAADDTDESVSTVLSDQSSSSEEEEISLDGQSDTLIDLAQLQIEFKARDEMIDNLTRGIDPVYAKVLRDNEQAVRRQKIIHAKKKHERQQGFSSDAEMYFLDEQTTGSKENAGFIQRLQLATAFDLRNTLPGAAHLIFYCVAHLSCFQVVESFSYAMTKNFENQVMVEVSIILGCILLLRVTGGMWDYLVYESYLVVKFDMHNRLRLGERDARVALWFRHHFNIREFLNLAAFYAAMESISSMHWRIIERADRYLTILVDSLGRLTQQVLGEGDTCPNDDIRVLQEEDIENTRSYSSHYIVSAIIAIGCLQMMGHPFLER